MDYLKKNHLSLLIIAFLVVSAFLGSNSGNFGINRATTTISNPFRFQQGITNDSTLTQTGASTFTGAITAGVVTTNALTQGGGVTATSTVGTTVPLLATDFDTENVIDVTLNVRDATLSFPATTTLTSFIPTSGQMRTLFVRNASTTAAMDITIAGGTGVLLKKATTSAVIYGDTDGANYGVLQLIRKANTDIELLFLGNFVD
jgi:hypothetical protein